MITLAQKVASACALAVAMTGLGAGAAHAEPEPNCVGVPTLGGLLYTCATGDAAILPRVTIFGVTTVGGRVPPVCYLVDCTEEQPVFVDVPVAPGYANPTRDVLILDVRTECGTTNGCYDGPGTATYTYYRLRYDYVWDRCEVETNDPDLAALNRLRFDCTV